MLLAHGTARLSPEGQELDDLVPDLSSSGMYSAMSRISSMAEPMDCPLVVAIRPGTGSPAATRW
jgi:hypothetical protein